MTENSIPGQPDELLDAMVRDFCKIGPKPKSEVRRRILEWAASGASSPPRDPVTSAQELSQFQLGYQRGIAEAANWIQQQTGPKWYELIHRKTLVTAIRALHPPKS